MFQKHDLLSRPWLTVFEGDEDGQNENKDGDKGASGSETTFTQDQLDSAITEATAEANKSAQAAIRELEALKKKSNLTQAERNELSEKIEELEKKVLTTAELADRDKKKLEKEHTDRINELEEESKTWRSRFTKSTIRRAISDAAVKAGAYDSDQIHAILASKTRMVEIENDDGEPTGKFTQVVDFPSTDKEGKPITLELSIPKAIEQMVEQVEKYGNLFKSTTKSGLGGSNKGAKGSFEKGTLPMVELGKLAREDKRAYREYRKKHDL